MNNHTFTIPLALVSAVFGAIAIPATIVGSANAAWGDTLVQTTEIKSVPFPIPILPPVIIEIPTEYDTGIVLTVNPPIRITRPNLERIVFFGGVPLPFFNRYISEIPWPILVGNPNDMIITDELVAVTSVMATGSEQLLEGFESGIVTLESATFFGISGVSYNSTITSVSSESLANFLPEGTDLSVFDTNPGGTYWLSTFEIPANDFVEKVNVPESSSLLCLLFLGTLSGASTLKRKLNSKKG